MRVVAKPHTVLAITLTPGPSPACGRGEKVKRIIPEISARRREASGF